MKEDKITNNKLFTSSMRHPGMFVALTIIDQSGARGSG